MGINFNVKQDYSFLFSNLNGNSNNNNIFNSINLSDYNSIKSGTYGKLLKEYYKKADTDEVDSTSKKTSVNKTDSEAVKELKQIQTDANALRDSASKLMQRGSSSVLGSGDMDKAYSIRVSVEYFGYATISALYAMLLGMYGDNVGITNLVFIGILIIPIIISMIFFIKKLIKKHAQKYTIIQDEYVND